SWFVGDVLLIEHQRREWMVEAVGAVPTATLVSAARTADKRRWQEFFDMSLVDLLTDATCWSPGATVTIRLSGTSGRTVVEVPMTHGNYEASSDASDARGDSR